MTTDNPNTHRWDRETGLCSVCGINEHSCAAKCVPDYPCKQAHAPDLADKMLVADASMAQDWDMYNKGRDSGIKAGLLRAVEIAENHMKADDEVAKSVEASPDDQWHPGAKSEVLAQHGHIGLALYCVAKAILAEAGEG